MSERRFSNVIKRLSGMNILARFPMHDAAWDLDEEIGRREPAAERIRACLEGLLGASCLAASDPLLSGCLAELEGA